MCTAHAPQQEGKPCGGEKLLLMFDRWRKLAKAFYSEKKNQFDISKVGREGSAAAAAAGAAALCLPGPVISVDGSSSRPASLPM